MLSPEWYWIVRFGLHLPLIMRMQYAYVARLIVSLLILSQSVRWIFYAVNHRFFNEVNLSTLLNLIWHSLRFDLSSTLWINTIFMMLFLLPIQRMQTQSVQKVILFLFLIINSIGFLFEIADIFYFPYTRKRMTSDVFSLMSNASDVWKVLPSYLLKFWYVLPLAGVLLYFFWRHALRCFTNLQSPVGRIKIKHGLGYILILASCLIGIRGGIQLKPIIINNAISVTSSANAPLVYGSIFSIIHSFGEVKMKALQLMPSKQVFEFWNPIKKYHEEVPSVKRNVVVIIVESYGKMYSAYGGRSSATPFLDSLFEHGLLCNHAIANASSSATGLPAILAGIPNFYHEPFTTSPYGRNTIDGLGNLLLPYGYRTSFFHGGENGTMNFNVLTKNAGFEKYLGKNEYPNKNDDDGTWGIYDEPFLLFVEDHLNKELQPFGAAIFTLSSHEPFSIPKQHQDKFKHLTGIRRGLAYTDYSLQQFFNGIKKTSWYQNTLFVITADHNFMAGHDEQHYYDNGLGLFEIPIFYFCPADTTLRGVYSSRTQQIDILPSVIDYLKVPSPFFCFGNSIFQNHVPYQYNKLDRQQLFVWKDTALHYSDTTAIASYHLAKDSFLTHSIPKDNRNLTTRFMAFQQWINQSLIHNQQSYKTFPDSLLKK